MVIDHRNILTVNNRMCSRWLFTIETIEIHYQNTPVFPFIGTFWSILGFIEILNVIFFRF